MKLAERIDRTKLLIFKIFIRIAAMFGAYDFLARFCARYVTEFTSKGSSPAAFPYQQDEKHNKITVLVLDLDRFRGDVELFAQSTDIRILNISWNFLRFLLASHVYNPTEHEEVNHTATLGIRWEFALAKPGTRIYAQREKYRAFLHKFLPAFLKGLGVDIVMNSDHRYRREADFTRISNEMGFPHLCYYREALYIVPAYYELAAERHEAFAPFKGTIIAVQNDITQKMFIESGMVDASKLTVRGCPRMDTFIQKIKHLEHEPTKKYTTRQIVYFSSPRGAQTKNTGSSRSATVSQDLDYFDFFSNSKKVVQALVELAFEDPKLNIILKMKELHIKGGGGQINDFNKIIADVCGTQDGLPNVRIETGRMSAQDIILESDLVCGMQTTAILEAAIAGKPIILPHFTALREADGADQVLMYQDHRELFDVPNDAEMLKEMVKNRLEAPKISEHIMTKRRALFEEHVSPLTERATEVSLSLIRNIAAQGVTARDKSMSSGNEKQQQL